MHSQTASRTASASFHRRARTPLLLTLLVAAAVVTAPAKAVQIQGLNDARVEVRGQGERERERGFRKALEQVIVRVTGDSGAPANPDLDSMLANPGRYVQTFRYRPIDDDERDVAADGEDPPTHYLHVSFNGSRLERDLRDHDVVVWARRRPEVLLWVGVDEGRDRYLVGEDDGAEAREVLRTNAERRGLPLLLPLLDLEDRDRIDFIDIRAPFLEAIEAAAERYRADTQLIGHVSRRDDNDWIGEWTLLSEGRETGWQVRARDRDAVLGAGIDGATDRLSALLAGRDVDTARLYIHVEALRSRADYARVSEYLNSLARVQAAEVDRVRGDGARFRVDLRGHLQDFERTLSLGRLLEPVPSPAVGGDLIAAADTGESVTEEVDALDALIDELLEGGDAADGAEPAADPFAPAADETEQHPELYYRLAG